MSLRRDVADLLPRDDDAFRRGTRELLDAHDLDTDRLTALDRDWADVVADVPELADARLEPHERRYVRRARALADVPLGITFAGPVYEDNPIRYADGTFRELTGYSLADVRGENLRLLQGPDTAAGPVDSLREALDIWEPVTVELLNYRKDGRRFRNCVSLVPVPDDVGTVSNWFGLQAAVGE